MTNTETFLYLAALILGIGSVFGIGYLLMLIWFAVKGIVTGEGVMEATKELRSEW